MKFKIQITCLVIFLLSAHSVFASPEISASFPIRVRVDVTADKDIKGRIESYIKKDLQSLHDVTVTNEDAAWRLGILALSIPGDGDGHLTVLSVTITNPISYQAFSETLKDKYKQMFTNKTGYIDFYIDNWLRVSDEDLAVICSEIVADFNSQYLEQIRQLQLNENVEKNKPLGRSLQNLSLKGFAFPLSIISQPASEALTGSKTLNQPQPD